jgi:hypothetical protein
MQGIARRLGASGFLRDVAFDLDAYAAAEALDWVGEHDRPGDGTYVLGPSRTVMAVAVSDVSTTSTAGRPATRPDLSKVVDAGTLVGIAEDDVNVVLGLVQTDFTATNLWAGNAGDPGEKPRRFAQVEMEPGTYVVVLRHGHLALVSLDGRYAWYLQRNPVQAGNLLVVKRRTDGNPHVPAAFRFDAQDDRIEFELFETLSRPDPELKETYVLRVRLHLETHRRALRGAEDWARHPR